MVHPRDVLWIGGAQWAGKSTVAHLLSARYPLVRYVYDYHDARSHADRARSDAARFPTLNAFLAAFESDPNSVWVEPSPQQMAEQILAIFAERFQMVLEDLAAIPDDTPVLAEGWGLRPGLLAPHVDTRVRAVFLVPSESFRENQLASLQRSQRLDIPGLSDSGRAQRNRIERDRLLGLSVSVEARRLGFPIIEVDGSEGEVAVAERVERQFRPFLPDWLY